MSPTRINGRLLSWAPDIEPQVWVARRREVET